MSQAALACIVLHVLCFGPALEVLPVLQTQGTSAAAAPGGQKETAQERLKRLMQAQLNKAAQKDSLANAHKKIQVCAELQRQDSNCCRTIWCMPARNLGRILGVAAAAGHSMGLCSNWVWGTSGRGGGCLDGLAAASVASAACWPPTRQLRVVQGAEWPRCMGMAVDCLLFMGGYTLCGAACILVLVEVSKLGSRLLFLNHVHLVPLSVTVFRHTSCCTEWLLSCHARLPLTDNTLVLPTLLLVTPRNSCCPLHTCTTCLHCPITPPTKAEKDKVARQQIERVALAAGRGRSPSPRDTSQSPPRHRSSRRSYSP